MCNMKITQKYIANALKVSTAYVSNVVNTKTRPSWKRAKQLARVTGTNPVLWLDGTKDEIKSALDTVTAPEKKAAA